MDFFSKNCKKNQAKAIVYSNGYKTKSIFP